MRPRTINRSPRYVLTAEMTMTVVLGAMRLFRIHSSAEKAEVDAAKLNAMYKDTASLQGAADRLESTMRLLHQAAREMKHGDLQEHVGRRPRQSALKMAQRAEDVLAPNAHFQSKNPAFRTAVDQLKLVNKGVNVAEA